MPSDDLGHRTRRRRDLGADLHVGHVRRAEGGDLLAAAAARDRQAHGDDHGPRSRRRRLRLHAAVPFERGAGRLGAVARHAVRGRARPPVLGVGLACPTSAATARRTSTTRASRWRTCSRSPSSPTTPTTRCASRSATKDRPRSSTSFARRFGVEVIDAYGATEGGVAVNRDADMPRRRARPRARSRAGRRRRRQREAARRARRARPRAQRRGRASARSSTRRASVRSRATTTTTKRPRRRRASAGTGRATSATRTPTATSTSPAATPTGSASTARTSPPGRSRKRCATRPASCSRPSTACPTTRPATR